MVDVLLNAVGSAGLLSEDQLEFAVDERNRLYAKLEKDRTPRSHLMPFEDAEGMLPQGDPLRPQEKSEK